MNFRFRNLPAVLAGLSLFLFANAGLSAQAKTFTVTVPVVHGGPEIGFDSGLTSIGRLETIYGTTGGGPPNVRHFNSSSAICTALRAAPFKSWSPETQKQRPLSKAQSLRRRPTAQLYLSVW